MTFALTALEAYDIFARAWADADAFAKARDNLRRQMIERGGDGMLRDVEISLAEDGRSVIVYANFASEDPVHTGFMLQAQTDEEEFHDLAQLYRALCERP